MSRTRNIAICGLLTAVAFALNWLEFILPSLPGPGFKLGLANIVTLYSIYRLNSRSALAILIGRCLLSALLFGGVTQLVFSLFGGIFAYSAMLSLIHFKNFSPYGVSIAGASAHNIGQTTAAVLLTGTLGLYSYLIFLLPAGLAAGLLTAFLFERVNIK